MIFSWTLLGCTTPEPPSKPPVEDTRPDIVLITIDTLRADRLGSYGDQHAKTPNLDALAREGYVFAENHSVTPLTLPSHASMLTGLLPKNHQVRDNAGFVLDEKHTTIAESLQRAGYKTGGFISAYVLSHSWGIAQGFETYYDPFHPQDLLEVSAFGEAQLPGNEVLNEAKNWWRNHDRTGNGEPRFAWIHLYDPHTPWNPPASWEGDPYRGEIAKVDHWLGDVFEMAEDAWIIVTSDHGESLWEHGEREHGVLLHRSVTRVPLIIRPPNGLTGSDQHQAATWLAESLRPDGVDVNLDLTPISGLMTGAKIVREPASGIDVAPTIASMAGIDFSSDGRDLLEATTESVSYAETYFPYFHYGWHPLSMIQNAEQRMEVGARVDTVRNQDQQPMEASSQLLQLLTNLQGEHPTQTQQAITPEQEAALQSLGYQSSFVFPDVSTTADPRDKMSVLMALHTAEQQEPQQGIPALRAIVESEPTLIDARLSLSYQLSAQGDFETALQECVEVLHMSPNHSVALNNAVILSHKLKQFDVAIQFAETMMLSNPRDVRPHRYLAAIYAEQEQPKKVIEVAASGLAIEPNDPNLNYLKGLAHVIDESFEHAIPHLQAAEQNGSRANDIYLWMGTAAERLNQIDDAVKYYDRASSDMPVDHDPMHAQGICWLKPIDVKKPKHT
jgi:arylsulfatase A-like enzyme/Tfp pilus assembly protein PilF